MDQETAYSLFNQYGVLEDREPWFEDDAGDTGDIAGRAEDVAAPGRKRRRVSLEEELNEAPVVNLQDILAGVQICVRRMTASVDTACWFDLGSLAARMNRAQYSGAPHEPLRLPIGPLGEPSLDVGRSSTEALRRLPEGSYCDAATPKDAVAAFGDIRVMGNSLNMHDASAGEAAAFVGPKSEPGLHVSMAVDTVEPCILPADGRVNGQAQRIENRAAAPDNRTGKRTPGATRFAYVYEHGHVSVEAADFYDQAEATRVLYGVTKSAQKASGCTRSPFGHVKANARVVLHADVFVGTTIDLPRIRENLPNHARDATPPSQQNRLLVRWGRPELLADLFSDGRMVVRYAPSRDAISEFVKQILHIQYPAAAEAEAVEQSLAEAKRWIKRETRKRQKKANQQRASEVAAADLLKEIEMLREDNELERCRAAQRDASAMDCSGLVEETCAHDTDVNG